MIMNKFVQGSELNFALERLIKNAEHTLLLISPYIKLHSRIRDQLKLKKNHPELKISIVYGKSENGVNKLSEEDMKLFRELPNIEIRYEKNLHAKYYANESEGLITSMNLYDYSQNNNIEAGVLIDVPNRILSGLSSVVGNADLDGEAYSYFTEVLENAELLFLSTAKFEKKLMGFQTNYVGSAVDIDIIDHYHDKPADKFVGFKSYEKKADDVSASVGNTAYCIRTGEKIPFNLNQPYTNKAFRTWQNFANPDYPEYYCHSTGEECKGETSFKSPILRKNWKEAKAKFRF